MATNIEALEHRRSAITQLEESGDTRSYEGNNKWLDAHYDPVASIYTFTQCITLSDINADGDWKLIIADLGTGSYDMKLKVYKGVNVMSENTIIDLPTGVVTFYMDVHEPRTPAIAVASGPYIYVYKNLRPYFKFTLPPLEVNSIEEDVWNQAKTDSIDPRALYEMLDNLKHQGVTLTTRSLAYLHLDHSEISNFYNVYKNAPLKRQTVITCLSTLKKSMADEDGISCLVLGAENKAIYVLDPEAFTVLATMELPSVPVFLSVTGLHDVEFNIVVACRNGSIYTFKRGSTTPKYKIELSSQAVGLERVDKTIVVGCMDETLQCYSTKGKKLWEVKLPSPITSMEMLDHKPKGFKAVCVALNNQEVHIYKDKYLVNTIRTEDVVTGMRFGRFGREDGALVMTTRRGGLMIKLLKRTSTFEEKSSFGGPPPSQNVKLNIPKKTKLFVDQTMRERENAVAMHRTFQRDLYLLRLKTARNYVHVLENSMNPVSSNPAEPIKLSAQVNGIGPVFKMSVHLQNTSLNTPVMNLLIVFDYDNNLYTFRKTHIQVPFLVPGVDYVFETFVDSLSDKGLSDNVKVYVVRPGNSVPLVTGNIAMPVSETMVIV